jgi:signal peptidase II
MTQKGLPNRGLMLGLAGGVALVDVITKELARTHLVPEHFPREIISDFLRLTLVYNPGAAFGLNVGTYSRPFFTVLTIGALWILLGLYKATANGERIRVAAIGLVIGGALGNLINRLWSERGVVDFLDVGLGSSRWPTFNVADVGVSVGACLLAWVLWREDRKVTKDAVP